MDQAHRLSKQADICHGSGLLGRLCVVFDSDTQAGLTKPANAIRRGRRGPAVCLETSVPEKLVACGSGIPACCWNRGLNTVALSMPVVAQSFAVSTTTYRPHFLGA